MNNFQYNWNSLPEIAMPDMQDLTKAMCSMTSPSLYGLAESLPSMSSVYESDILQSNLTNLSSVMQQFKSKCISQHITLIIWNVIFDMMDNNIDFDEDSMTEQFLKAFNSQITDSIMRAKWKSN